MLTNKMLTLLCYTNNKKKKIDLQFKFKMGYAWMSIFNSMTYLYLIEINITCGNIINNCSNFFVLLLLLFLQK
jgi:hypothetical protein